MFALLISRTCLWVSIQTLEIRNLWGRKPWSITVLEMRCAQREPDPPVTHDLWRYQQGGSQYITPGWLTDTRGRIFWDPGGEKLNLMRFKQHLGFQIFVAPSRILPFFSANLCFNWPGFPKSEDSTRISKLASLTFTYWVQKLCPNIVIQFFDKVCRYANWDS